MIERQLRIVDRVNSLVDAWAFVMACLDEVSEPSITISPVWRERNEFRECVYDVVVQGQAPQ